MLNIETLKIKHIEDTIKWSSANIIGEDMNGKPVHVAKLSYRNRPNPGDKTKERQTLSCENLIKYIQEHNIRNLDDWDKQPHKVKLDFVLCFHEEHPLFA